MKINFLKDVASFHRRISLKKQHQDGHEIQFDRPEKARETDNDGLPIPPDNLALRVGGTTREAFMEQGRGIKKFILSALPEDYDFAGKKILDFGCGCGRVLRHFQIEARKAEFWGCDIDYSSTSWMSDNFPADFRVFNNTEAPHLPIPSNYFDLIYVISIFTHLTKMWKPWLLELRRVLSPGGIALITFHNRIAYEYNTGKPFDERNTGMLFMHENRHWDDGGPMVYHSNWWAQKHWGQFFDIDYISREGLFNWQSLAALRKNDMKEKEKAISPVLQPYVYQFHNSDFIGQLEIKSRRTNYLKYWHGLEIKLNNKRAGNISGWFASKSGKITNIKFVIDNQKRMEIPGTNMERVDVQKAYPDWPYSFHSGFEATLHFSEDEIGEHQLKVIATDSKKNRQELLIPLILYKDI